MTPRRSRNSGPAPEVVQTPQGSGLAVWRKRQADKKREIVAELDRLREQATVEVREGREFRVVRLPDRYEWPSTGGSP